MTILGVGTDLVDIRRIEAALQRFGGRFVNRVLTADELAEWQDHGARAAFVARRFAAKEAVSKAFGCGIGADLAFRDIQVGHDSRGAPRLEFLGRGAEQARRRGVTACHLSLSDERFHALAFVVLEGALDGLTRPDAATTD